MPKGHCLRGGIRDVTAPWDSGIDLSIVRRLWFRGDRVVRVLGISTREGGGVSATRVDLRLE